MLLVARYGIQLSGKSFRVLSVLHCNRLASFEDWFAANREGLTSEFSESQDEAALTVLAMKKYRQLLKVFVVLTDFDSVTYLPHQAHMN